jgi:hypothetical protein
MNTAITQRCAKNVPISLVAINSNITLARVRVGENESDSLTIRHIASQCGVPVIKVPEHAAAVLASTLLDTLER